MELVNSSNWPASRRVSEVSNQGNEEECLDPRVQVELEKLNNATDEINKLEATLEEANNAFRSSLNDTSIQLQNLAKRLGSCIEKARPYYEATEKAKKLQLDCQRAAIQYQRANAVHQAARETISLAEERFSNFKDNEDQRERKFDSAWQEMLNHATMKIMEAEAQKTASEKDHFRRAAAYTSAEREVQDLLRGLKSSINKSRPYFNFRTSTQIQLEARKERIHKLQKEVSLAKQKYSMSLHNLEQISEEIHENRRANMKREPGVGAEMDQNEVFSENSSVEDTKFGREQEYWKELKSKFKELETEERQDYDNLPKTKSSFSALPPLDPIACSSSHNFLRQSDKTNENVNEYSSQDRSHPPDGEETVLQVDSKKSVLCSEENVTVNNISSEVSYSMNSKPRETSESIGKKSNEDFDFIGIKSSEDFESIANKSSETSESINNKSSETSESINNKSSETSESINNKSSETSESVDNITSENSESVNNKSSEASSSVEENCIESVETNETPSAEIEMKTKIQNQLTGVKVIIIENPPLKNPVEEISSVEIKDANICEENVNCFQDQFNLEEKVE